MAISHPPFRPFSHQISILKNSFPQVMLCYVFTPWEKKSENLKQSKTKWWISKWRRWQERSQGRPLSGGPSPVRQSSRTFFVVFQLWQPVGNLRAAILIFAIQFYDRKDDLDLNLSGQLQWLTGCKRLWTVFLGGLCWTRWMVLGWRNVASCKHCLLATAMFPSTLFFFNLIFIHDFVLKYKLVRAGRGRDAKEIKKEFWSSFSDRWW